MAESNTEFAERNGTAAVEWIDRDEPGWMRTLRRKAYDEFSTMSWPTPQEEEWRRTDVTTLDFGGYAYRPGEAAKTQARAVVPENAAGVLRFSGRTLVEAKLKSELAEKGVRLLPLAEALSTEKSAIEGVFAESIGRTANRLQSWHYSQWTHGAFLSVPRFVEIEEPFFLDFEEGGKGSFSAPHVLVMLDTGARAVVVQRIFNGENDEILCNEGADLRIADSAALEFIRVEDLSYNSRYFNHSFASIGASSAFKHLEVVFGSKLYKSRLEAEIVGSGGDIDLNGIYFGHKKQHLDIGTIQRHEAPNANSRTFYKGAVRQKARTIYRGLIEVSPNGAQTDAYLTNKNLVLNDGACSDSIPMLKINTNDVKCSHGSTTGKLDDLQLFYLMTRGFSRSQAERVLITAFFDDVILQSHPSVREELQAMIQERLG
ncbi:MAG TPA: Fe-S cluster assembly protein SufD [Spirochaetia bacterium]|nr:Fe-S cluster assembly protein SufD [Spirochaetia bacterium]